MMFSKPIDSKHSDCLKIFYQRRKLKASNVVIIKYYVGVLPEHLQKSRNECEESCKTAKYLYDAFITKHKGTSDVTAAKHY